jgi:hypothetical protein
MKVSVFAPDLMDRSRFDPLKAVADVAFVSSPQGLDGAADVVIADLGRPGSAEALESLDGPRRVGFVSHVDTEGRRQAAAKGVDVHVRSKFFRSLVEIVTEGDKTPG